MIAGIRNGIPTTPNNCTVRPLGIARTVVGLIWLAGAAFNALVTMRMSRPYAWLEQSPVPIYRWFFSTVVGNQPRFWTALLVIGEAALGGLTLGHGKTARIGLAGGALFSAFLCSLASSYTRVMGIYAAFLAWLARSESSPQPVNPMSATVTRIVRTSPTPQSSGPGERHRGDECAAPWRAKHAERC